VKLIDVSLIQEAMTMLLWWCGGLTMAVVGLAFFLCGWVKARK